MLDIKEILWRKWLKSYLKGIQGLKADPDEPETELDSEDEFVMPDGTKIPKMPPSRPHWG